MKCCVTSGSTDTGCSEVLEGNRVSRIGKLPITIPHGVDVKIDDKKMTVKGPKGELTHQMPGLINAGVKDGSIVVTRQNETKQSLALHGLNRSLIANMVEGVSNGFTKILEIVGIGYRAEVQGKNMTLSLGFSHPIIFQAPPEIDLAVDGGTRITVSGFDKQLVGQVAAIIRSFKKPEPYKGKGIKYDGEHVRRKAGKTGI